MNEIKADCKAIPTRRKLPLTGLHSNILHTLIASIKWLFRRYTTGLLWSQLEVSLTSTTLNGWSWLLFWWKRFKSENWDV